SQLSYHSSSMLISCLYTLSLHDALPIWLRQQDPDEVQLFKPTMTEADWIAAGEIVFEMPVNYAAFDPATNQYHNVAFYTDLNIPDRKSTRLNSSHQIISYAVFCLKKKI